LVLASFARIWPEPLPGRSTVLLLCEAIGF
jgi:hypothetical protein